MRRTAWDAPLCASILLLCGGCGVEPSPLSPTPEQAPDRHAIAIREMENVARRNREAEAAFHRRLAAPRRAGAPDTHPDRTRFEPDTTDSRETL